MKRIWKYELPLQDIVKISAPVGFQPLAVAFQSRENEGEICVWALVEPDGAQRDYTFRIFGTGHPVEDESNLVFIGTAFMGSFVWHVFQVAEAKT